MTENEEKQGLWTALTTPGARYPVLVLLAVGVVVGAGLVIGTRVMVTETGTDRFCGTACHEMQAALKELEDSSHGRNRIGLTASCHDCHIPHEYPANLIRKAQAGARDVYHHLLGTLGTPEKYEQNRVRLARAELARLKSRDSAECRHCHDAAKMDLAKQSGFAAKSHREAAEKRETCVECHTGVAHKVAEEK
ncbi:MAG TPA: NapC/NirT family cytochrome c [Burkholderiales bacterium]|nr:NapC/NirT family cytochrome c [Burkholderiales bacterium]